MSFNSLHNFLSLNAKIFLNQVGKPGFSAGFQSVSNSKKLIAVWQIFIFWIQCGLIVGSTFQHKLPPVFCQVANRKNSFQFQTILISVQILKTMENQVPTKLMGLSINPNPQISAMGEFFLLSLLKMPYLQKGQNSWEHFGPRNVI